MFPFLKRRARDRGWLAWPTASALGSRRALLLSPRQFDREIARERVRSTRRSIPFCVLTIELVSIVAMNKATKGNPDAISEKNKKGATPSLVKKQSRKLVDLMHRNLRMTDEKGVLSSTRYGVLLVDTPEMGGRAVLDRMTLLFVGAGLDVKLSLQVYDPEGFGDQEDEKVVSEGRRRDDSDQGDWVRRPSGMMDVTTAVLEKPSVQVDVAGSVPVHVPGEATGSVKQTNRPFTSMPRDAVSGAAVSPADVSAETRVSIASEDSTHHWPWASRVAKRVVDVVGASVGLVLTGPFIVLAMAVIKWSDGGPALFCQTREGRYGRPFTIFKLRTMVVDAEKAQAALRASSHRDGPAFKISRDPRVTKVGHFLRATCLDELPQLINVLKGDMSLVGPRPLPWHESRACERWHRRRLDVRPGLTCIWQIDKSKAESFDDWMRMDLQYIDRLGFFRDLQLIARTVIVPVTGRGGE